MVQKTEKKGPDQIIFKEAMNSINDRFSVEHYPLMPVAMDRSNSLRDFRNRHLKDNRPPCFNRRQVESIMLHFALPDPDFGALLEEVLLKIAITPHVQVKWHREIRGILEKFPFGLPRILRRLDNNSVTSE